MLPRAMLFRIRRLVQAEDITNGTGVFWSNVCAPDSRLELTSSVVLKLVDFARLEGAGNMANLVRLQLAGTQAEESAEERRKFYRFKNFLNKTEATSQRETHSPPIPAVEDQHPARFPN